MTEDGRIVKVLVVAVVAVVAFVCARMWVVVGACMGMHLFELQVKPPTVSCVRKVITHPGVKAQECVEASESRRALPGGIPKVPFSKDARCVSSLAQ